MTKDKFFAQHVASSPKNLIMVTIILFDSSTEYQGIFSTLDKAKAWASSIEGAGAVFAPFIVDDPAFGQIPQREMQ